jgi:ribosomal protein S18 acetylase RimI-like enzyme
MANTEMLIRPFEASDQEATRRLILDGLGEHFGYIDESLNPDLDDIMTSYIVPGHVFVVVLSGSKLVGTGALIIKDDKAGQLVRISVHADHRREGIGRAVVKHLVEIAKKRNLVRVLVETNNDWYDAIGLYKHLGFIEYNRDVGSVYMALEA